MSLARRSLLFGAPPSIAGARSRFRFAVCSETFAGMSFAEACRAARRTGYEGIEIEPAHLGSDPAALNGAGRAAVRREMSDAGLAFAGLHSFLKAPAGLHLTTPDAAVRRRGWDYFRKMIDLAADLGEDPIMVLGSARQRSATGGMTPEQAVRVLEEGLAKLAPHAAARGVTVLVEPLAPSLSNVVNTLEEAVAMVKRIGSRAVASIFDTHNTPAETLPHPELIKKFFPYIRHVHLNELDGRHPGSGGYPFEQVLRALGDLGYRGWLSVEVFDFKPDGETVARAARNYLRRIGGE